LIRKANLKHVAYDEKGRELDFIIDEGLTSYDPFLESSYYIKKRLKILHYRNGEIYKRKY